MKLRFIAIVGATAAIAGCATTGDPIAANWNGKSAGAFFAKFGPPMSDDGTGSVFTWKGGYKRVGGDLKSCGARISVSNDYRIKKIEITSNRQGEKSESYCHELLAPDSIKPAATPEKKA